MGGEDVQALHPVGHAAGRDALDLRHLLPDRVTDRGPVGEVRLVRPAIGRRELWVGSQPACISLISPDDSRVPIREFTRGQVR